MDFKSVVVAAIEQAEAKYGKQDDRWEKVHNYRAVRFAREHFRSGPINYIHATYREE